MVASWFGGGGQCKLAVRRSLKKTRVTDCLVSRAPQTLHVMSCSVLHDVVLGTDGILYSNTTSVRKLRLTTRYMAATKHIGVHPLPARQHRPPCSRHVAHAIIASVPGDKGCKQIAHFLYNFVLPQWHALKQIGWLGLATTVFLDCTGKVVNRGTKLASRAPRIRGTTLAGAPEFVSDAVRVLGATALEPLLLPQHLGMSKSIELICIDQALIGCTCARLDQYNRYMAPASEANDTNRTGLRKDFVQWRDALVHSVMRGSSGRPQRLPRHVRSRLVLRAQPWPRIPTAGHSSGSLSLGSRFGLDLSAAGPGKRGVDVLLVGRKQDRLWLDASEVATAVNGMNGVRAAKLVYFDGLSLAQQMELASSSEIMMGIDGSGLSNANWMRAGAVVIDVVPYFNRFSRPALSSNFRRMWGLLGLHVITAHAMRNETQLPRSADVLMPWCRGCLFSGRLKSARSSQERTLQGVCNVPPGQLMWCLDLQDTRVGIATAMNLVSRALQMLR